MAELNSKVSASRAVVKSLCAYILKHMPSLKMANDHWPNPSDRLMYPAATVFCRNSRFIATMPYVLKKEEKDNFTGRTVVQRAVGNYEFSLQIDLWSEYKPQRESLYEEIFQAFNENENTHGINLQLKDYFDQWAHYSISEFQYIENEESAQKNEWRLLITVLATTRAVAASLPHLIEKIENTIETPSEIPAPAIESPKEII